MCEWAWSPFPVLLKGEEKGRRREGRAEPRSPQPSLGTGKDVTEVTQCGHGLDGGGVWHVGKVRDLFHQVETEIAVLPPSLAKEGGPHFLLVAAELPQAVMSGPSQEGTGGQSHRQRGSACGWCV